MNLVIYSRLVDSMDAKDPPAEKERVQAKPRGSARTSPKLAAASLL